MKRSLLTLSAAITIALLPAATMAVPAKPAEDPPRIVEIRALYQQIVKDRELAYIMTDRYEHNTLKLSIPARGPVTYQITVWRYDELIWQQVNAGTSAPKIWLAQIAYCYCMEGSGSREMYEFLFDEKNNLIFFYQSAPKSMERRYYFTGEKPVRVVEGKDILDRITAEHRFFADGVIMRAAYELKRMYMPDIFMK
jgi:hypothetical protein